MQRVNAYQFYRLASVLKPLTVKYTDTVKLGTIAGLLIIGRDVFDSFMTSWRDHLGTSRAAAESLRESIEAVINRGHPVPPSQQWNLDVNIFPWEVDRLAAAISKFETVLAEETATASTYLVEQKSIFSTPYLMDKAEYAFEKPVREALSQDATRDFQAAGRCLAFDLFTASGFHTVRCLESVVGAYHDNQEKKQLPENNRTLGGYHAALKAATPAGPEELLGVLSHIKDTYRNAVIHASGWHLTEGEATGLFHVSQSAIRSFVNATIALT